MMTKTITEGRFRSKASMVAECQRSGLLKAPGATASAQPTAAKAKPPKTGREWSKESMEKLVKTSSA